MTKFDKVLQEIDSTEVVKISEDEYSKLADEAIIHMAETGFDREYPSTNEYEDFIVMYINDSLGTDNWEVIE